MILFISTEDFFEKVNGLEPIKREEELECARKMKAGDSAARERIINGYLPLVASVIKKQPEKRQSMDLIYRCLQALEKAVDTFDFLQEQERFVHRLSWWLRQTVVESIAERP